MKSRMPGSSTSPPAAEVVNVSPHGIWLAVDDREFLLSFADYPWFRDATIRQIHHVVLLHGKHLHWPDLDVDLELECLLAPDRYPLVDRA